MSHAKAGNINHALRHLATLPSPPDFIAVLDADFVPFANFVSRALCLFRDPSVGIVQTPQHFFNPDPIQSNLAISEVFPDEQRFFFDIIMPARDAWELAASGMRLAGSISLSVGAPATVFIRPTESPAVIARKGPHEFAISLIGDGEREALTRRVYSECYGKPFDTVRPTRVLTSILQRLAR